MLRPLYLVRHGQSEWNVRRLTQGQTAHPRLTELGRAQALEATRLLADDLAAHGLCLSSIVSSDLVRAVETAEVLAERFGLTIELEPRLREQHLGWLEGRGYDETWAAAGEHDWSDPALPVASGESPFDVRDRMAAVMAEVDRGRVVVLVSHGEAIRAALAHVSGVALREAPWVDVPNGAVARVEGGITWLG